MYSVGLLVGSLPWFLGGALFAAWLAQRRGIAAIVVGVAVFGGGAIVGALQVGLIGASVPVVAAWLGGFGAYGRALARARNHWDAPGALRWALVVGCVVLIAGLVGAGLRHNRQRQAEPLQAGAEDICRFRNSPRQRFECRVLREFKAEFPGATAHWAGGIEVGLGIGEGTVNLTLSDLRFSECSRNPKQCRALLEPLFEWLRAERAD